jgi:hypothetical protein
MILYTTQYPIVSQILETQDPYRADWDQLLWAVLGRPSYKWMVEQMKKRGIDTENHPPIWAWSALPTQLDTDALLGILWNEETDWDFFTLDCPDHLVLLSSYGVWNMFFSYPDLSHEKISMKTYKRRLFRVDKPKPYDRVQACLPYLKKEWIVSCVKLKEAYPNMKAE